MEESSMGDPDPSDWSVPPSFFGNQVSPGQVLPISGLPASVRTSSAALHSQPLPYLQPVDHPSASFRHDGYDDRSHATSVLARGPSTGHRDLADDLMRGRCSHSGDTLDLVSRATVGEADSPRTLSDDLFTYPEGEDGAVTITQRDLECLKPRRFLRDNVIDFYIQYLRLTLLSQENKNRFHFFNSFFFSKLLQSCTCMSIDEWKVDYVQLRKWIGNVNLFERDYVFIPIIHREHWSLVVICHLTSLDPRSLGGQQDIPCVLHLDPIEGGHKCIEGQVRSFIFQAWMERMRALDNMDSLHALFQMKYVEAKVPQQENKYDCGLYILHYIEVFLSNSTSWDLTLPCERGMSFTRANFRVEISNKRNSIQSLILNLGGTFQIHNGSHLGLEPMPQEEVRLAHPKKHHQQGFPKHGKEEKSKKWKVKETSVLLKHIFGGGCFIEGKHGAMDWNLIAKHVNAKNIDGRLRSKEQCRNRFDTLLKAYKELNAYCLKTGKGFCNVSEEEKRALKLATPLGKEQWYNRLQTIHVQRSSMKGESCKSKKLCVDGVDVSKHLSSPLHPSVQSVPTLDVCGSLDSMNACPLQVVVKVFLELDVALRYTFLNLIQLLSSGARVFEDGEDGGLEDMCRILGIVQDQNPCEICKHVYELQDRKLVTFYRLDLSYSWFGNLWVDRRWIDIPKSEFYKSFGKKLSSKNFHLKTFYELSKNDVLGSEQCLFQELRVLVLYGCQQLENVDLGNFPNLRMLEISSCDKLKVLNGWEGVKQLGWISISDCPSYCNFPNVQFLSYLKEFYFWDKGRQRILWQLANFNHCIQLRRLEICFIGDMVESMDLITLRCLEVLSFEGCEALSTIHGLSGLQMLKQLCVRGCKSLKMLPELGNLKALIYLDMRRSGIVEIGGLKQLHLLTWLSILHCKSLESLPPLGHMKALAYLDLSYSSIEEILGVEDLVSLETLLCYGSKLKQLPNLNHLCQLHSILLHDTPLCRLNSSTEFVGGYESIFNNRKKEKLFVDDISDDM